ncbi:lipopolysaccharide biosynthesis protein [Pontibacter beigongshangensis]|uniref:lipopolysaccharide biosynthesis protein n=1 Tax=Pontibacter beigongshangensis TaxID=2574733 RepID=UPI00164FC342|nr:lipopolysaccharide biosynthesis protein [Pontibacter beigongshangensis]
MELRQLKGKIVSGLFWSSLQLLISRVFSFVIKLILAKLLFPEQFGIVGMATVFTSFVQVFNDLGIGAALVQRKEENLREEHYNTAFWTGVLWAIGVYLLILFIVAPMAAVFYKEPILRSIIPVLSIGVLCSPVNLVHKAQLNKQMSFKKLALIDNSSSILSGILSVGLAYMGAGVWALVFHTVATIVIAMPLYFKATRWLPKFQWDKQAFKDVFGFGIYTTGTNFFSVLMLNLDYLLIGKLLSASALGVYTLAFVLTDTFRYQLTKMINKVMYPVYGKKQDEPDLLKLIYFKVVKYNSICLYPIMTFLIVLGEPFILGFFGVKWVGAILPLKILALSVMIHLLVNSHAVLIRGLGKARVEMRMQLIKSVLYVPTIAIGVIYFGIVGAAWAYVINKVMEVAIAQYYLKKFLNVSLTELLTAISPPLIASLVAFMVTYLLYTTGMHYFICAMALALSYSLVIWLMMRAELTQQLRGLMRLSKKKAVS